MTAAVGFSQVFETIHFPAGEPHVRCIVPAGLLRGMTVLCDARDWNDLLGIRAAADICPGTWFFVPYLPFGRADKSRDGIETNVAAFAARIVTGGYRNIKTLDPHSAITAFVPHYTCADFVRCALDGPTNIRAKLGDSVTVVVPDAGARSKAQTYLHLFPGAKVVMASKRRDPDTGGLSGFELDGDAGGGTVVIVDDIIDGGGTFIGLADTIRGQPSYAPGRCRMILIASHGLFTKGTGALASRFDYIVTMLRPPVTLFRDQVCVVDPVVFLNFMEGCNK